MKTRVIAIAAILLAAAAVAAILLLSGRKPAPAPPATATAPATVAVPRVTGNYADDWQADCAPLAGPAQAACTTQLDTHYGKTDAAPVPLPSGGGY